MSSAGLSQYLARGSAGALRGRLLSIRFFLIVALLAAEWLPISAYISTGRGGQSLARALVAFGSLTLAFGYYRIRGLIPGFSRELEGAPMVWRMFALHVCAMAVFLGISLMPVQSSVPLEVVNTIWLAAGLMGIVLAALAFIPARLWLAMMRATGYIWIAAAVGSFAAWRLVSPLWSVWRDVGWKPATDATFALSTLLLRPFFPSLISDRAATILGTQKFAVTIGAECSGIEGAGLMLVFCVGWLLIFRREYRFPRALFLIPAGMAVMFLGNSVRIAALILIGNAGAPGVAMGGFHSQAGWIVFNVVALGFSLAVPRVVWLTGERLAGERTLAMPSQAHDSAAPNPTVPWLLPFAVILASGMVSRAVSAGFEWFYPLRFFAAAAALWMCRRKYLELDWTPGWLSPLAGAAVFVLWIALDRGPHTDGGIGAGLAALSAPARLTWLSFRVVAATITVPIAEELAFRGFLLRRLIAADFEAVDFRRFSWFAVLLSSVAFGLMHGDRWIAGTVAGVIYATVMIRKGNIGSAVVAHATTNALLAAWVLIGNRWYFW
ncbi:MAG TPA: exosortase E/protease, VPEID-CTERM system [Bryobacteraceae bacterium]|jgi:exosortase E/protease (VPEID-CTERM system)|nr:exosortase E/protease, VPEID-CTERM system [Bryobacteraceae bacterium]